jgi:hypothetical protein
MLDTESGAALSSISKIHFRQGRRCDVNHNEDNNSTLKSKRFMTNRQNRR